MKRQHIKSIGIGELLIVIFLLSGCHFNQSSDIGVYTGTVECTQYDIQTEARGKIKTLLVEEGQSVKQGDLLVKIDDETLKFQLEQAQAVYNMNLAKYKDAHQGSREENIRQAKAALDTANAKLKELLSGNRPEQIKQGEFAVQQAQHSLELAQKNYDYRKKIVDDYQKLQENNALSLQQLEQAQNLLNQAENQVLTAKNQAQTSKEQLSLLKKGPTQHTIDAAKAAVDQSQANYDLLLNGTTEYALKSLDAASEQSSIYVDLAKLNLSKTNVVSPISGTLLETWIKKDEIVSPGSIVATVGDLKDLWMKIYIEEKYYPSLSLGKKVKLSSDFIDEEITGEIIYMASTAEFTPKNTETKEAKQNRVFEIKIKILDHIEQIKPGMNIEVFLWTTQSK